MKVISDKALRSITGRSEDMIYYTMGKTGKIYARRRFKFKNHPGQAPFASAQRAIYALQPSEQFKEDLKVYMAMHNNLPEKRGSEFTAWTNIYNKMMFTMQKKLGVNLAEINREIIVMQQLPCINVHTAVCHGLLPEVGDTAHLTRQL